jgi:hypothetical protein
MAQYKTNLPAFPNGRHPFPLIPEIAFFEKQTHLPLFSEMLSSCSCGAA